MDVLVMEAQKGNKEAMAKLCKMHEGAVHKLANRFRKAVPFSDGVQYGYLGLLRAVRDYDPTKANKFLTFAWYKIFGAIQCSFKYQEQFASGEGLAETLTVYDNHDAFDNQLDLSMLDDREKDVLDYFFVHGLSSREVAAKMNLSYQGVLNIKKVAFEKVRSVLRYAEAG